MEVKWTNFKVFKSFVSDALTWVYWAYSRIMLEVNKENGTDGALLFCVCKKENSGAFARKFDKGIRSQGSREDART